MYDKLYQILCSDCICSRYCHEECEECDKFNTAYFALLSVSSHLLTDDAITFIAKQACDMEPYDEDVCDMYANYVASWFLTHDEGEPACFDEWYDNEYEELQGGK
jgi:hypothetical protein